MQKSTIAIAVLVAGVVASSVAFAVPQLYWTEWSTIRRDNLDGAGVQTLVTGQVGAWTIAVDPVHNKMYWGDVNVENGIFQADMDGSNVARISVGVPVDNPAGMAIDSANGMLYWSDFIYEKVYRTNLATLETTTLANNQEGAMGMELDLVNGKLYWANFSGSIQRCNLDGSNLEVVIDGLTNPRDVALDLAGQRIFWPDLTEGAIYSANLDGTNKTMLVSGFTSQNVAFDPSSNQLYFGTGANGGVVGGICRIDSDGSNLVTKLIMPEHDYPYGLTIVPEPASLILVAIGFLMLRRNRRHC